MSWWEWSQWQPDEWRQDDGWRQAWADTQFLGPLLLPDAPPERIAKATDDAAVAADMEVPVARVTDEAAVVTDEVEPGTASANASGQQSSSAGPHAAPPPPGSAAPAPGIASAPATSGQPSSSARPSAASPPPGPATPAPGPASAPDFEEYIAQVCREYGDTYEEAMPTLSQLPFQAEGYRHLVCLIANYGSERIGPTVGSRRRNAGWDCDIVIALSQTCPAIHAWYYDTFDGDKNRVPSRLIDPPSPPSLIGRTF